MLRIKFLNELFIFLSLFASMSLLFYWLLNGGAYAKELRYSLLLHSPLASKDLKNGTILELKSAYARGTRASAFPDNEYMLIIPKISVATPIVRPHSSAMNDILAGLEEGVGLYPGSDEPGKLGRGVLLGHSSRASWYRGNYATIFALLNKLEEGDSFYISRGNTQYRYRVFSKKILTPSETNELLDDNPRESEIDLITCHPIGSASKRTVIQGTLVKTENL